MAIAADLLWFRIICVLVIAASIFNGGLKCVLFSDELPPSATRLLISLISCANWTGYASRSGKRFYQSGNRSNRSGGMGTGQNRPIANLPLATADLRNRLRQSIHRPRPGKTCNSGAPTKPAGVSRWAALSSPIRPRRTLFVCIERAKSSGSWIEAYACPLPANPIRSLPSFER